MRGNDFTGNIYRDGYRPLTAKSLTSDDPPTLSPFLTTTAVNTWLENPVTNGLVEMGPAGSIHFGVASGGGDENETINVYAAGLYPVTEAGSDTILCYAQLLVAHLACTLGATAVGAALGDQFTDVDATDLMADGISQTASFSDNVVYTNTGNIPGWIIAKARGATYLKFYIDRGTITDPETGYIIGGRAQGESQRGTS